MMAAPRHPPLPDRGVLRVASCNASHVLPRIHQLLADVAGFHILAVQEAYVLEHQMARLRDCASALGWSLHAPSSFGGRGALVLTFVRSFLHAATIQLDTEGEFADLDADRFLLVAVGRPALMCGNFYGHASDAARRAQAAAAACGYLRCCGRDAMVLGDWNELQSEGMVGNLIANGVVFPMDTTPGPPTRPGGGRRIDYGVMMGEIYVTDMIQLPGVADHDIVGYELYRPAVQDVPRFTWPRVQPLADEPVPEEHFATFFPDVSFKQAIDEGDTGGAWRILSDAAEAALSVEGGVAKRAVPTRPVRVLVGHTDQTSREPVRLRRLRRARRRLVQLLRDPRNEALRATTFRCIRSLDGSYPIFRGARAWCIECARPHVDELIVEEEATLRRRRIHRWQADLDGDLARQRAWVKKMPQAAVESRYGVHSPSHPADVLEQQARSWTDIWNRPNPADPRAQDDFLSELESHVAALGDWVAWAPPEGYSCPMVRITAGALVAAVRKARTRASGPDNWRASQLLALPSNFWSALALLWNTVLDTGEVPEAWTVTRIALLPKETGGYRPLGIASLLWRAGMSVVVRALRPWSACFAEGPIAEHNQWRMGEAADRARGGRDLFLLSEDLAKAFDTVHVRMALSLAWRLGLDPRILRVLDDFYRRHVRLMTVMGFVSAFPLRAHHGLLQGCPASPMLLSVTMAPWAHAILERFAGALVPSLYADDRSCWMAPPPDGANDDPPQPDPEECANLVGHALEVGSEFDAAFGFVSNIEKLQLAATPRIRAAACAALPPEVPETGCVAKVLGVLYDFDQGRTYLDDRNVAKAVRRLSRIRVAARHKRDRQAHARSLVIPIIAWAAGLAVVNPKTLRRLRGQVRRAVAGWTPRAASDALTWIVGLQPEDDPVFVLDRNVFLGLRRHAVHCRWGRGPRPAEAARILPALPAVLDRYEATYDPDEAALVTESRRVALLVDGRAALRRWMRDIWATSLVRMDARVCCQYSRTGRAAELNLACGMNVENREFLGPPVVGGHRKLNDAHLPGRRSLALAAGPSYWSAACRHRLSDNDAASRCPCGAAFPSFSHLIWCCPVAPAASRPALPRHRAAERLGIEYVPPCPGLEPQDRLVEDHIAAVAAAPPDIRVWATDGSATPDFVAAAFAIVSRGFVVSGRVPFDDQSPYLAEVFALYVLIAGIVRRAVPGAQLVLADCSAALDFVRRRGRCPERPLLWEMFAVQLRIASLGGISFAFEWVPAHGRRPEWSPVSAPAVVLGSGPARELNDMADEAARAALARVLARPALREWAGLRRASELWEARLAEHIHAVAAWYELFFASCA
mmetsp:Transcript_73486/g.212659  ORF Transcript_73486/g.212659 Transcript_73486/m.212659 type:complete len:1325 (-) Transcript_73486:89-4063(-)